MDILAHGLMGGIACGRSKKTFLPAMAFGMLPDLSAFGFFLPYYFFMYGFGKPPQHLIPPWVSTVYTFSHSLVIFAGVFLLVWAFRKKPAWIMLGWPLHILCDIPTHTAAFFGTPFLFPLSSYQFDGIRWGTPWVFASYWFTLITLYSVWGYRHWKNRKRLDKLPADR